MVLESATLAVGNAVAGRAGKAWLGARTAEAERGKDLVELIKVRFPDHIHARRVERQLADIADSVVERLRPLCEHEFGGLTANDKAAVLAEVVDTLNRADLSDDALLAADADPARLSRTVRAGLPPLDKQLGEAGARLCEVVLDECCDCLVRIVLQLPQFGPRASAETLARLTGLADRVATMLSRLPARSLYAPEGTADDAEFTRTYLDHVSRTQDTLELFGVRFERLQRPQTTLSVAYISLNVSTDNARVRRSPPTETRLVDWGEAEGNIGGAVRVESVLAKHRRLLVRGEAGSGKSTLLRWIAITAARGRFTGELAEWNGGVPFLIKLRSYADERLPAPEEFIDGVADPLIGIMPRAWVHRCLSDGRAIMLVDGVDELASGQRQGVRSWLTSLLAAFPELRVVVTSRPAAAGADWLRAEGFGTGFLERMSPADLRALVEHWHTAVRQSPDLPCPPERLPGYEARLLARLEAAPHLRILAANPLLAAMLCALNLDREQLPRDRMGLYGAALDLLLETRDAKRDIPSFRDISLEHDQKIRILQDLAWQLSTSNRVELPKSVATRMIGEKLRSMPRVRADAVEVLDFLLQRSGVLREPVPGRVDFVHRTVQEYLAAKQAADLGEMELLVANAHRDAWWETVVMAAGHANEPLRRDLIAGLLARVDAESKHARRLKLLVAACLETLPSIPRDLNAAIDRCLDDLVPPRDLRSARSLATAGEPVLSRLPDTLDGLSIAAARAVVRTAWLINGPEALDVLARYAADPRVGTELNDAWAYFDPEEYARRVLAKTLQAYPVLSVRTGGQLDAMAILPPVSLLYVVNVAISDLGFLARQAETLTHLTIYPLRPIADLSALSLLSKLAWLQFELPGLTGIDFLAALPPLRAIWLANCDEVADYTPVERHTSLTQLGLVGSRQLTSIEMLPLRNLSSLNLGESRLTCGLESVANAAPHLKELVLFGCPWVDDLSPLVELPLHRLSIEGCDVEDIRPLGRLARLTFLNLANTRIDDLAPLARLRNLSHLWLDDCAGVSDLSPLASLTNLRYLHIRDLRPGIDLTPLAGNRRLRVFIRPGQEVQGAEKMGRRLSVDFPL